MFYTDTHIHLQDYKHTDVKNVVNNATKNNVRRLINPSAHPSDWQMIEQLMRQFPQVIPAFGIHPWYIEQSLPQWKTALETLLQKYPHALIGECGIDKLKNSDTQLQLDILKIHVSLAKKYERSLILHIVKAYTEARDLFADLPPRTVFHSYNGPCEWGDEIVRHGFFIGCNQALLRKKNAVEIIKHLDLAHLLLETDGPYQNIVPQQPSLAQNLPILAAEIAKIKQMPLLELQEILFENTKKFLGEV